MPPHKPIKGMSHPQFHEFFGIEAPHHDPADDDDAFAPMSSADKAEHEATLAGEAHRDRMQSMGVQERRAYMRGLRNTLNDSLPKRGDFDNPFNKEMPPEPKPPRQPRPQNPMVKARRLGVLARRARGSRRR